MPEHIRRSFDLNNSFKYQSIFTGGPLILEKTII